MPTTHPLPVQWKLARFLERQRVTPHALMKATGLSPNTIYPIVRGKAKAISFETLGVIAAGIESLTGQRPEVADLFEIADTTQPDSSAKLAALLKTAKPPRLSAAALLGPDDWTVEELEASHRADFDMVAEQKKLQARQNQREQEFFEIMREIEPGQAK